MRPKHPPQCCPHAITARCSLPMQLADTAPPVLLPRLPWVAAGTQKDPLNPRRNVSAVQTTVTALRSDTATFTDQGADSTDNVDSASTLVVCAGPGRAKLWVQLQHQRCLAAARPPLLQVTSQLLRSGSSAVLDQASGGTQLVLIGLNRPTNGVPWVIRYSVADAALNLAVQLRLVVVECAQVRSQVQACLLMLRLPLGLSFCITSSAG